MGEKVLDIAHKVRNHPTITFFDCTNTGVERTRDKTTAKKKKKNLAYDEENPFKRVITYANPTKSNHPISRFAVKSIITSNLPKAQSSMIHLDIDKF